MTYQAWLPTYLLLTAFALTLKCSDEEFSKEQKLLQKNSGAQEEAGSGPSPIQKHDSETFAPVQIRLEGVNLRLHRIDWNKNIEIVSKLVTGGGKMNALAIPWKRTGNGYRGVVEGLGRRYDISIFPDALLPKANVKIVATYIEEQLVSVESLRLIMQKANDVKALGRNYLKRRIKKGKPLLVDRWTPLEVTIGTSAGECTLTRNRGFPSAEIKSGKDQVTINLELDNYGNHPFTPYARCSKKVEPHINTIDMSKSKRRAGEQQIHEAELWIGPIHPLRMQRLPKGFRAAVVFTSHADRST